MASKVTVTAKTGPAVQNTALVLNNLTDIRFDLANLMLYVTQEGGGPIHEYSLTGVTTVTCNISGRDYTWVVS